MTLKEKLNQLNYYSSPELAAYADRDRPRLASLASYKFRRVGGGRELMYAKWNKSAIKELDDESFDEIISRLKVLRAFIVKFGHMSISEFCLHFKEG